MTATNGRLPPMHETPILPVPDAPPADLPAAPRVKLSAIEVDALERMEAAIRHAMASIILSRGGDPDAEWLPERDERGRIVAFSRSEKGA